MKKQDTFFTFFKQLFVLPSEKEQISTMQENAKDGIFDLSSIKSISVAKKIADFNGLESDLKALKKRKNQYNFALNTYKIMMPTCILYFIVIIGMFLSKFFLDAPFGWGNLCVMSFSFLMVWNSIKLIKAQIIKEESQQIFSMLDKNERKAFLERFIISLTLNQSKAETRDIEKETAIVNEESQFKRKRL